MHKQSGGEGKKEGRGEGEERKEKGGEERRHGEGNGTGWSEVGLNWHKAARNLRRNWNLLQWVVRFNCRIWLSA